MLALSVDVKLVDRGRKQRWTVGHDNVHVSWDRFFCAEAETGFVQSVRKRVAVELWGVGRRVDCEGSVAAQRECVSALLQKVEAVGLFSPEQLEGLGRLCGIVVVLVEVGLPPFGVKRDIMVSWQKKVRIFVARQMEWRQTRTYRQ